MSWDPGQYLRYGGERMRPAIDLLARIPTESPKVVVDAGCGPGNITGPLLGRWPAARYLGVDASEEMLDTAREAHPGQQFEQADLAAWEPDDPVDIIYSNATLHWLDNHERLFARLAGFVATGGCLAVQMPHNHAAPTHTAIADTIEAGPWADRIRATLRTSPVGDPAMYHGVLAPLASTLDIWETEYLHVLRGPNPVVEWTKGSVLRPVLDALESDERHAFLDDYTRRIADAYPAGDDGTTLMPFRRLFIVAVVGEG